MNSDEIRELITDFKELKNKLILQEANIRELKSIIENMGTNVLHGLFQAFGIKQKTCDPSPDVYPDVLLPPQSVTQENSSEKLCIFIHPAVSESHGILIHNEIRRLVKSQRLQEICRYLLQMRKENKILLPVSPQLAYAELVRMGMPQGRGFNETTFRKYYRN